MCLCIQEHGQNRQRQWHEMLTSTCVNKMTNFLNSYCETKLDDIQDFDFMFDTDLNALLIDGRYPGMLQSDLSARLLMDMVLGVCFVFVARIVYVVRLWMCIIKSSNGSK